MSRRVVRSCAPPPSAKTGRRTHGASATRRILESRRFGSLDVSPETVIRCPSGLLGFEEFQEYILVQPEGLEPLSFLVACENPDVAFPVLAGGLCQPGYAPAIPTHVLESLGAATRQEVEVLAICTMAPDTGTLHANLRGPVVLNPASRLACQVALDDGTYSLRHLLGAG